MGLTHLLSFLSVLRSVGSIVLAVAILLAMVTIHEFGHYVAGKLLHFKINEFSVGFGPALLKKRSKKTGELFALRLIPLGGYCAFEGEDDADEEAPGGKEQDGAKGTAEGAEEIFGLSESDSGRPEDVGSPAEITAAAPESESEKEPEKAPEKMSGEPAPVPSASSAPAEGLKFNDQPPWKRIVVLIAGATMNYLLALVIIVVMFTCLGRPRSYIRAVPETQVTEAGTDALQADDIVLSVDGKDLFLITDYVDALSGKTAGEIVPVEVLRLNADGRRERMTLSVPLQADGNFANMSDTGALYGILGINPEKCEIVFAYMKGGFWESLGDSFVYSWKLGGTILRSLGELLTGKLGLSSMGGPVTTIRVTAEAASYNLYSFLNIAGFIGVNLAVFNLLPIPALDGSKVIFCIIEWIRKKPLNRKVETMIHFIGIIFLLGFAVLVDLLQFF